MILEILNFLHFLGLAFGLGGATIAFMILRKAERDIELGKQAGKIISSISKLIGAGLLLLIISGIGISFLVKWPINKNLLIIKHILVFWIIVFGVIIGVKSSKLSSLSPKTKEAREKFLKTKKQLKFFSILNLILWYLVTLLSAFV